MSYRRLAAICFLTVTASALANDSASSSAAGGIQLIREPRISMEKERLTISADLITVEYEFLNTTSRDVTTQIAFPLAPNTVGNLFEWGPVRPIKAFRLWVDGQERPYDTEVKAFAKKQDQTALLKKWNIDIASFGHFDFEKNPEIERLTAATRREFVNAGLIDSEGKPLWDVRTTYHWNQTFPAGKVVRVKHEYQPAIGFQFLDQAQVRGSAKTKVVSEYCLDPQLRQTLAVAPEQWGTKLTWVDYILTTANSWKTPIKDFELVIQKGTSHVSLCWDGKLETGPNGALTARIKNFRPSKELRIGFFDLPR
jgi:hypothetical protein